MAEGNTDVKSTDEKYDIPFSCKYYNDLHKQATMETDYNTENVQVNLLVDDMKKNINLEKLSFLQDQPNKSVFLRAIDLSPCKHNVNVKKVKSESESNEMQMVDEIRKDDKERNMGENTDFYADDWKSAEMIDDNECLQVKADIGAYEQDLVGNTKTDGHTDGKTVSAPGLVHVGKLEIEKICVEKDVHFSSPLAVVYEYNVSQTSCSQSSVSLLDSDSSQNLDTSSCKANQLGQIDPCKNRLSDLMTPGGDCFNVQVSTVECKESLYDDATQTEVGSALPVVSTFGKLEEGKEVLGITSVKQEIGHKNSKSGVNSLQITERPIHSETYTLSDTSTDVLIGDVKENLAVYYNKSRTKFLTEDTFDKVDLSNSPTDQNIKTSPELKEDTDHEQSYAHVLKSSQVIENSTQKNNIDMTEGTKDVESVNLASVSFFQKNEDMISGTRPELLDEGKESLEGNKLNDSDPSKPNKDPYLNIQLDSLEVTSNFSQDLFTETSPEARNTPEIVSCQTDVVKQSEDLSGFIQLNYRTTENFRSVEIAHVSDNVKDIIESNSAANNSKGSSINEVIKFDAYENSSQKDLFESDTSSETVTEDPVEEECTSVACNVSNAASNDERDITRSSDFKEKNEVNEIMEISTENENSVSETEKLCINVTEMPLQDAIIKTEAPLVNQSTENTLVDPVASLDDSSEQKDKRNSEENNDIANAKRSRISDECIIKSLKHHNLLKNSNHDDCEIPFKKPKLSEVKNEEAREPICFAEDVYLPETLTSIASKVVNNLDEDIVWTGQLHVAQKKEKSKDNTPQKGAVNSNASDEHINTTHLKSAALCAVENKSDMEDIEENIENLSDSNELQNQTERITKNDSHSYITSEGKSEYSKTGANCPQDLEKDMEIESEQTNNIERKVLFGGIELPADHAEGVPVNKSPVFITALEYHSQCSQESSTGFEPKVLTEDLVMSSQGSAQSVPVITKKGVHSITEVSEEGLEIININNKGKVIHVTVALNYYVLACDVK